MLRRVTQDGLDHVARLDVATGQGSVQPKHGLQFDLLHQAVEVIGRDIIGLAKTGEGGIDILLGNAYTLRRG